MKKKVFVLRIGDYRPDLCEFTIPTIKSYANKIGAEYVEITERKYTDFPVPYEKVQIYELGKDSDWNILIDADIMIHPEMPDLTEQLYPGYIATSYAFDASRLFAIDKYFARDERNTGLAANFVITSKLTHDLWEPLPFTAKEAKLRVKREFILDEYTISRNLAKYGLKHTGVLPMPLLEQMIVHFGNEEKTPEDRKSDAERAKELFNEWKFNEISGSNDSNG